MGKERLARLCFCLSLGFGFDFGLGIGIGIGGRGTVIERNVVIIQYIKNIRTFFILFMASINTNLVPASAVSCPHNASPVRPSSLLLFLFLLLGQFLILVRLPAPCRELAPCQHRRL